MATTSNVPITGDTPIAVRISVNDSLKKLKLPLKDLSADALPTKLRLMLGIPADRQVVFERFSDSAGGYITLDPQNPAVFKTLIRAAKAKLKLKLKVTVEPDASDALKKVEKSITEMPTIQSPVIAHTPQQQAVLRDATGLDRRSVGSGIFQFKEARDTGNKEADKESEAPLPRSFSVTQPADIIRDALADLHLNPKPSTNALSQEMNYSVYCNECDASMDNVHFHCSICDAGDYDLCETCVEGGKLCPGEGHWLVKRYVKDGKVISSTTERLAPKPKNSATIRKSVVVQREVGTEMPGAFTDDTKTLSEGTLAPTRTCNNCVSEKPDSEFVTCTSCDDYDLCLPCHSDNKHGHHPAHAFAPATSATSLSLVEKSLLAAGRNVRHHALCDGCDKTIYGIRHKCFNCPDFDYCSECVKQSRITHPQHRFAALYEPISMHSRPAVRHPGIYCDGPVCSAKTHLTYIEGVRYKCVVCHDTDFCADCEALPSNPHNKTHPLIKIKTPIRGLNVSTVSENPEGVVRGLGDKKAEPEIKQEPISPARSVMGANATSTVQTVADIKPTASIPIPVAASTSGSSTVEAEAHFVRDTIPDGMSIAANTCFAQVWTLRNPGPVAWPAGCSVRYVGGDNMLNLDNNHASSASEVAEVTESNVVGREVQVGEEVAFKVTMKAPVRQGKSISYWRLKSANGTPFGHRLWCDIIVTAGAVEKQDDAAEVAAIDTGKSATPLSLQGSLKRGNASRAEALRQHQQRLSSMPGPRSYYEQYKQRMDAMRLAQEQQYRQAQEQQYRRTQEQQVIRAQEQQARQAQEQQHSQLPPQQMLQLMQMQQRAQQEAMRAQRDNVHRMRHQTTAATQAAANNSSSLIGPPPPYVPSGFASTPFGQLPGAPSHMPSWKQQLEDFVQRTSTSSAAQSSASTPVTKASSDTKQEEESAKEQDEEQSELKTKTSQMIFPTLDKESPANSTYQSMTSSRNSKGKAAYVEDEATGVKTADAATSRPASPVEELKADPISMPVSASGSVATDDANDGFEDVSEDLEVLSAADGEDSDDGFLTDEEYDILDASDQETVVSSK